MPRRGDARTPLDLALERKRMTARKLAEMMGTPEGNVSRYRSGKTIPPNDVLRKMAALLEVEPSELSGQVPFMTEEERQVLTLYRSAPNRIKAIVRAALSDEPTSDDQDPKNLHDVQDSD